MNITLESALCIVVIVTKKVSKNFHVKHVKHISMLSKVCTIKYFNKFKLFQKHF